MSLPTVLWLGGGSGAGKSTLARMLAYRHDLRLYRVDSFAYPHQRRLDPQRHPHMARLAGLSHAERFVEPSPRQQADDFLDHARDAFAMIVEDLAERAEGPIVLAEGPSLLPELVAPLAGSAGHALWLLPTTDFNQRNLSGRYDPFNDDPTARTRRIKRAERDRLLTEAMRSQAAKHGLPVLDVDGSLNLEQTAAELEHRFAAALTAGPRARDGAERARVRRAENDESHTGVSMYLADLGADAPAAPPPLSFGCECRTLGCAATVSLTPAQYRDRDAVLAH